MVLLSLVAKPSSLKTTEHPATFIFNRRSCADGAGGASHAGIMRVEQRRAAQVAKRSTEREAVNNDGWTERLLAERPG